MIERHGEPVGSYVPIVAKDRRAGREALGRLGELVDELVTRTGLDEDELAREITPEPRRR